MLGSRESRYPRASTVHAVVSLREMLEKYAFLFGQHTAWLAEFKMMCAGIGDGKPITEDMRKIANAAIDGLKAACILSDMDAAIDALDRLRDSVNAKYVLYPASAVGIEARQVLTGLWAPLETEHYFHLRLADVPLFNETEPFGFSMPELMVEDVSEAAKCLALQRGTACVFHLMRVMELAVSRLGKKLHVRLSDPRAEAWANIINHVNQKIQALPTRTRHQMDKKRELATLSAHLNAVRIATRNEVMHPKQTYTIAEARDLFDQVKLFMGQYLKIV